jgi:glutamine synthetase
MTTLADIERIIQEHQIHTVKIGMPDMDGVFRGKRVPRDNFLAGLEGGFAQCDVLFGWDIAEDLIPNLRFTGWDTGYPDVWMKPDLSTFGAVPWDEGVAQVICDFVDEQGEPVLLSPRSVLQRVLERAAARGYQVELALELEFRIFRETQQSLREKHWRDLTPLSPTNSCYSVFRSSGDDFLLGRLMRQMNEAGITVEGYNREHGPGMYEMNLHHTPGLAAADRAMLFRNGTKEICMQEGMTASFMAKWNHDEDGSSGHLHQSLWDADGKNIFYDPAAPHHISDALKHYAAGVLKLLPDLMALYAPNINSYKRYVVGTWAPTTATWGIETRTTALRVVPGSMKAARIENRTPGADTNPYLTMAASLASGLYGLEHKLELPPAARGNAYALSAEEAPPLPRTLEQAIERFNHSDLAREFFGDTFVDHYVAMRRWEVQCYTKVVDEWQRERYFEMI